MIRRFCLALAAPVLLGGLGVAHSAEPGAIAAEGPRFESIPCEFADAPADWAQENGVTCGWVRVPAHHGDAGKGTLRLWVAKVPAVRDSGRPPIIRVMGGPEAVRAVYITGPRTTRLRQNHDIAFFDYRGVGRSEPKPACNVEPVGGETIDQRLVSKLNQYATCREQIARSGIDLSTINSRENARDIDAVARALGYGPYYVNGGSYGSTTTLELIRTRPPGLRAAVIGNPFPPNTTLHDTVSTFALSLQQMQEHCDLTPVCAKRHPDLAATLGKAMDRFDRERIASGTRRLQPANLLDSLWNLMVGNDFERVPSAIDFAAHGDAALVAEWVGATSAGFDFFLPELTDSAAITHATVLCADISQGRPIAADMRAAGQRYPYLKKAIAPADGFDRLCEAWYPTTVAVDVRDAVTSDLPVLMYSLRFDPTTPQTDGRLTARSLSRATLLEHPGGTHSTLLFDPCLIGMEAAFLSDPAAKIDRSCTAGWMPATFALDGFEEYVVALRAAR